MNLTLALDMIVIQMIGMRLIILML